MMKKVWMLVILALVVLIISLVPAYAQAADTAPGAFDWTDIIVSVIGALTTAFLAVLQHVWMKYVKPWLQEKGLMDLAGIVVNGVEVLMQGCAGPEKLDAAMEKIKQMGIKADEERIRLAIEAAWNQMHIAQVAAGMKEE